MALRTQRPRNVVLFRDAFISRGLLAIAIRGLYNVSGLRALNRLNECLLSVSRLLSFSVSVVYDIGHISVKRTRGCNSLRERRA